MNPVIYVGLLLVAFMFFIHELTGNEFNINDVPRERKEADLVFLLDKSGSVGPANFETEKSFVRNILLHFSVDPNNARVAVITYSDSAVLHIDYFRHPLTKCQFSQDIDNVTYEYGGRTNTGEGLRLAMDIFSHGRPGATKVIFLLSDGFANHGLDPNPIAKQLRDFDVKILAFGVGRASRQGLRELTGYDKNVFLYSNFREFGHLARTIRGDPHETNWVDPLSVAQCDHMCDLSTLPPAHLAYGYGCCSSRAKCMCGLKEGIHFCMCPPGQFGLDGTYGNCQVCPHGHYKVGYSRVDRCVSCPRHSTTNHLGATSVKACKCLNGYVGNPALGKHCSVVTCPPLKAPDHGKISPNCKNTFNSICKFGCDYGFHLREKMSKKRICAWNGKWSNRAAVCEGVTCPSIPRVVGANSSCNAENLVAGTTCVYKCLSDRIMRGNPLLKCATSGRWQGIVPSCEVMTCQSLPKLKNGFITTNCERSRQLPGNICLFDCRDGFRIEGAQVIVCNKKGKWIDEQLHVYLPRSTRCIDTQPPELRCPSDISDHKTDPGKGTALIKWNVPKVTDNGPLKPTLKVVPANCSNLPMRLAIGSHRITYSAKDSSGNIASCSFTVKVVDVEKPVVLFCPESIEITSAEDVAVTWKEPQFKDNSDKSMLFSQSHRPGQKFPMGPWLVTYEAKDRSGNVGTCKFNVIIKKEPCPYHPPPVNGAMACDDWMSGQFCRVYCNDKFEFAFPPANLYICSKVKWNTIPYMKQIPWPDCSKKGNSVARLAVLSHYYSGNCHDEATQLQIKTLFIEFFRNYTRNTNPDFCRGAKVCQVDYVNVFCGEHSRVLAPRVRREISHDEIVIEFALKIVSDEEKWQGSQQVLEELLKDILSGKVSISDTDMKVMDSDILCEQGSVLQDMLCVRCPVGTFYDTETMSCDVCPPGEYQDEEGQLQCKTCDKGTWTLGAQQKNYTDCKEICGPGTYSSTGLETCNSCPLGMYQPKVMQKDCTICPVGRTTAIVGARYNQQCQEVCPLGYVSDTGLRPCDPCPIGTYQDTTGALTCHPCPDKQATQDIASTNISDCQAIDFCAKSPCFNGGSCTSKQDGFLCVCEGGYSGVACDVDIDECLSLPCYNGGTCVNEGGSFHCLCHVAFTGDDCFTDIDECENIDCENNGTCLDKLGFFECACQTEWTGLHCETTVSPCDSKICLNMGTCIVEANEQPVCSCLLGFTGVECEVDIDECQLSPCVRGKCVDQPGAYICECPQDATGTDCDVKLNNCDGVTCENGGTCNDMEGTFTCTCHLPWQGRLCEKQIPTNSTLHFSKPHPWNYVKLSGIPDLTELTLELSCRNSTPSVFGTIISYAFCCDEGELVDNALTVSDMDSLQIQIMNQQVNTGIDIANGDWNHLIITWNNNGSLNVYVNGSSVFTSERVGQGRIIYGGGFLVLGQDQDSVGGDFSVAEAFVGDLTRFNVWRRVLTLQEIRENHGTCSNQHFGDVISFPRVIDGNTDHVTMLTGETCK